MKALTASEGWVDVKNLPDRSMKVWWLCEDGVEDIGFYYADNQQFASWDLISTKPITHWKPFECDIVVMAYYANRCL